MSLSLMLQGSVSWAVNTYANGVEISPYVSYGEGFTFRVSESGNTEPGRAEFAIVDKANAVSALSDHAYIRVQRSGVDGFRGFVTSRRPRITTTGRVVACTAMDISMLLDTTLVVANTRAAGESDSTRIKYLLATYGNQGLYNNGVGSTDVSKIQTLNAAMPKQKFKFMTLRQAIESVLGQASPSSNYYIDASGRLHTFDSDHPENDTAPYNVNVAHTLSATEAAPIDLTIDFDSSNLINDYYVRAKYRTADIRRVDLVSISLYGRRAAYIDAPDADTSTKAAAVGDAALRDTAFPLPRGSFTLEAPYDVRAGISWRAGQTFNVTSTQHGLSAKPMRVHQVGTEFVRGDGQRRVEIEFGAPRLRLRSLGTIAANVTSVG